MLSKIYPNGNKWIIYYLFLYGNYRTVITLKFNYVYDILTLEKTKEINMTQTKQYTKICKECGKVFTCNHHKTSYCCEECKKEGLRKVHLKASTKYNSKDKQELTKECPICHKKFITTDLKKVYCSKSCAKIGQKINEKVSREKNREHIREYLRKRYRELYKDKLKAQREANREVRICPICHKEFTVTNENKKYCSSECKAIGKRETNKKYEQSDKYKIARKRYEQSEKCKTKNKKYMQSEKGKQAIKKCYENHIQERLKYAKEYYARKKEYKEVLD